MAEKRGRQQSLETGAPESAGRPYLTADVVGRMLHDCKSPLTTVSLYLQLLDRKCQGPIDPKIPEYLAVLGGATRKLQRLIDNLEDYAHFLHDQLPMSLVDCNRTFDASVEKHSALIQSEEGQVARNTLPMLQGNEEALAALFFHLLENSLLYRRKDSPPMIQLRAKEAEGHWSFSFEDNGLGISESVKPKIFQPFMSGRRSGGNGLGLAICHCVVERHGGKISFCSRENHGTQFHFTLPKSKPPKTSLSSD